MSVFFKRKWFMVLQQKYRKNCFYFVYLSPFWTNSGIVSWLCHIPLSFVNLSKSSFISYSVIWCYVVCDPESANKYPRTCAYTCTHTHQQTRYIRVGIVLKWIIKKYFFLVHDYHKMWWIYTVAHHLFTS